MMNDVVKSPCRVRRQRLPTRFAGHHRKVSAGLMKFVDQGAADIAAGMVTVPLLSRLLLLHPGE